MNTRVYHRQKTRELIIEKGRDMFVEKGYEKTTLRLLAKRIDMSVGAIMGAFDSKEKLYLAIFGYSPYTNEEAEDMAEILHRLCNGKIRVADIGFNEQTHRFYESIANVS